MLAWSRALAQFIGIANPRILRQFKEVVDRCDPLWVSEHIAFTSTSEVDLGHLNPVPHEMVFVRRIADKAKELSDRCGKRFAGEYYFIYPLFRTIV